MKAIQMEMGNLVTTAFEANQQLLHWSEANIYEIIGYIISHNYLYQYDFFNYYQMLEDGNSVTHTEIQMFK